MHKIFKAIGIMSGTSLDGLDIAYCYFEYENEQWKSTIQIADTEIYSDEWKHRLMEAPGLTGLELSQLHVDYGRWIGQCVEAFIKNHDIEVDLIGCHGHTVFHQPENLLTLQIGAGDAIWSICQVPVVCDFRTIDIQLHGQGAPLVPIGDKCLYRDFDACLNLGGFANISFEKTHEFKAFDVCPSSIVLNHFARILGKEYDDKGQIARSGKPHFELIDKLNALKFYSQKPPKSLGKEWVDKCFLPLVPSDMTSGDVLASLNHHIAFQLSKTICENVGNHGEKSKQILLTGGGTYNQFLLDLLQGLLPSNYHCVVPDKKTIEYKEAQIFAFLGVLKFLNLPSNVKTVTGAIREISLGTIHSYHSSKSTATELVNKI